MAVAVFEKIITKNFPKVIKNFESWNQKLLGTLNRIKAKNTTCWYVITKLLKIKDKQKL